MRNAIAISLVAAVVSLSACHRPSYGGGARALASSAKKLGKKVVAIAGHVEIEVDAKAIAKDQVKQQVDRRVAAIEPISINRSVHATSTRSDAPQRVDIEPTITRHDAGGASAQVWKNMYRAGEKATCEKVATFESCSATCNEHMRGESMRQLSPSAGKPTQCECTQGFSKCG